MHNSGHILDDGVNTLQLNHPANINIIKDLDESETIKHFLFILEDHAVGNSRVTTIK